MRRIDSKDEFQRLHAAGKGYIYNDYDGQRASGGNFNVLHEASCRTLRRANATIPKFFAVINQEATNWLSEHRGTEGDRWRRCRTCQP